jgi:5-methylcytosine-specific restriction endonuclease McrA
MTRRHTETEIAEIKDQVRQRDGMRCTQCGLTNDKHLEQVGKSLHVHRLQPGSYYSVEGCITVCGSCHGSQAQRKPGERDLEANRVVVSVRSDLYEKMRQLANHNGRPVGWEIRLALETHLQRHLASQQGT